MDGEEDTVLTKAFGLDIETEDDKIWCVGMADGDGRFASRVWAGPLTLTGGAPVMHNAKFDLAYLARNGYEYPEFFDTILEAHLLGYRKLALRKLAPTFLDYNLKQDTIIGKKGARYDDNPESVMEDCSLDAWASWALHEKWYPKIVAHGWEKHYTKDRALIPVIQDMEKTGMPVDDDRLRMVSRLILKRMAVLEEYLASVGLPHLHRDLVAQKFWRGKPNVETTKTGLSTKGDVLKKHANPEDREWVNAFIEHEQIAKLKSTYIDNWKGKGRLHPSINQTGTMTGRFSIANPNIQNISKNKDFPLYQLFVAPEGYTFVSFDYSQIEYRVLANITRDPLMLVTYLAGSDLHQKTMDAFNLVSRFGDDARTKAKNINFGILYGIGPKSLAPRLGTTIDESAALIKQFYSTYENVAPWQLETIGFAEDHGYIETFEGRPLYVPGILCPRGWLRSHAEKQCGNYPIQGGAAEIVKDAMIRCPKYLVNQVHDELLYLVPENEAQDYFDYLKEALVDYRHEVPYTVEGAIGKTWGDIKSIPDLVFEED